MADGELPQAPDWLPEEYVLRLTALELGALMSVVNIVKQVAPGVGGFQVYVKGRDKPMAMIDRLIEKVEAARAPEHIEEGQ